MRRRGHLGLGSNQGDRRAALRDARSAIDADPQTTVVGSSSLYETAPQGEVLDQADFLNAVIAIDTELDAEPLLDLCKAVEAELGRAPGGLRHGPRPIDVDLLLLGDRVLVSELLVLPHREIATRRFVLDPLLELDPLLVLPDGTALAELAPRVVEQRVQRSGSF